MSLTPNAVAANLAELSRQLDALVTLAGDLDVANVNAKIDADVAESRAFLDAEGSVEARKHLARVHVEHLRRDAEVKAAAWRTCRARIDTLKVRIDVGRSAGSLLKSEMALGGPA